MTILGSEEFLPKASYAHTVDQINLRLACDTWLILCNDVDFGEHPTRLCIHTQTRLRPSNIEKESVDHQRDGISGVLNCCLGGQQQNPLRKLHIFTA